MCAAASANVVRITPPKAEAIRRYSNHRSFHGISCDALPSSGGQSLDEPVWRFASTESGGDGCARRYTQLVRRGCLLPLPRCGVLGRGFTAY